MIVMARGDGVTIRAFSERLRARRRRDGVNLRRDATPRSVGGESILSAEAICARLEALELTRSSCDLNSQPKTPTGLSWLSLADFKL